MAQESSPRCVIIGPLYRGEIPLEVNQAAGEMIICADGGYKAARAFGIVPDMIVGDMDSMDDQSQWPCPVLRLPREKDDTDMVACLKTARERGYRRFDILGATGGRADHFLGNIQCLADCAARGESAWLLDADNEITILSPGTYRFSKREGYYFSLLSYTPKVTDLTVTGTHWKLDHACLQSCHPLGVSNRVEEVAANVSFLTGQLIVIWSRAHAARGDADGGASCSMF